MTARTAMARRDASVVGGCLAVAVLQVFPPVLAGWAGYGLGAVADVALVSVRSPVLLGVVAFGVALTVGLGQPGLQPRSDVARGPVDEVGAPAGDRESAGPVREGPPSSDLRTRLRWAAAATLVELVVLSSAVVLDDAATAGAESFRESLDDGSAIWTFVVLVVQAGFVELRAPVAFAVAMVVLTRSRRPVRRRRGPRGWPGRWAARWPRSRRASAARTTRSSPHRRPG